MITFDEETLRKLENLTLVANRVRVGELKGERRSKKRGSSIEFADYRNYVQGDDLRRLDWNVYARFERPFIKLLEDEEELAVHILLDASGSMDWPDESAVWNKFQYGQRLAGALGYIALVAGDQVAATMLNDSGDYSWGPHRGRRNSLRMFSFLDAGKTGGTTNLNQSLNSYALRGRRQGLVLIISDLLSPAGYVEGLTSIQARGHEVALIQLLSPDEVDPPLGGDARLIDVETKTGTEITLDASTLSLYRVRLDEWQSSIDDFCVHRGIHFIPVSTDIPWDSLVLQTLRVGGVVK